MDDFIAHCPGTAHVNRTAVEIVLNEIAFEMDIPTSCIRPDDSFENDDTFGGAAGRDVDLGHLAHRIQKDLGSRSLPRISEDVFASQLKSYTVLEFVELLSRHIDSQAALEGAPHCGRGTGA